ncbi:MFS transporter [Tenggerimyces flavus]|uniref:MFS transporter n=1 Tax=Tenggerimyces flavus TaxID=1708749 RepID=A0ABV7YCR3_9ACTN|nr:MFS transporter [Tenggerimyces flavus]MBM7783397.1 MFS family permease [Tenggerimyces flavus]
MRQWAVLRSHRDFRNLFAGTTVGTFGANLNAIALPLTAVIFLDASPSQMGVLGAVALAPFLIFGLPAGVWVDRIPYRTTLLACNIAAAVLTGTVPLLAVLGVLAMWQLYVIGFLTGICVLFSSLASTTFVPLLVPKDQLLQANAALSQSGTIMGVSGSAAGGALVQVLTAPIALVVDAVSSLIAAVLQGLIRQPGKVIEKTVRRQRLGASIVEGFRTVYAQPILRVMLVAATLGALAGQVQTVVLMLFFANDLGLEAGAIGLLVAVAGVAGVVGALIAAPFTERVGHGPTFLAGTLIASLAGIVLAMAGGPPAAILVVAVASQVLRGLGQPLYSVNQVTVRQALTPPDMLARVNATWRFLVFGMQPIGALVGGVLGETVGLRATILLSGAGMLVAVAFTALSPIRSLRTLPA